MPPIACGGGVHALFVPGWRRRLNVYVPPSRADGAMETLTPDSCFCISQMNYIDLGIRDGDE
jgi:hypothetical protein